MAQTLRMETSAGVRPGMRLAWRRGKRAKVDGLPLAFPMRREGRAWADVTDQRRVKRAAEKRHCPHRDP